MKNTAAIKIFTLRWGPAILLMLVIFIFSGMPSSSVPRLGENDSILKKTGHMLGYALLSRAYLHGIGRNRRSAAGLSWLLATLYAFSDELHQSFVPSRGAQLFDVGIDSLGALISLLPEFILRIPARNRRLHPGD